MPGWGTRSAVVCRRGDVLANEGDGSNVADWTEVWSVARCPDCGGKAYAACPSCGARIVVSVAKDYAMTAYPFCKCGRALPWADRQARIHELVNLLDDDELDPGDDAMVRQQLEALLRADVSDADEVKLWSRVRDLAPQLWEVANGRGILTAVITAEAKRKLGLPV